MRDDSVGICAIGIALGPPARRHMRQATDGAPCEVSRRLLDDLLRNKRWCRGAVGPSHSKEDPNRRGSWPEESETRLEAKMRHRNCRERFDRDERRLSRSA